MLQRAFDAIAARRVLIEVFYALLARVAHLPYRVEVIRDGSIYYVTTGVMPDVLKILHSLADTVNTLVLMMVEANNLFETLLLVQVQQNSKRRLFARLCANSDGWERFMSSGLITTWNFPLEEYQFIATSLEEQTAFLQVNCRLLEEHFDTAFALLAPPWIDDPSATNRVAEDVLVDTERITTLLDTQYFVLLTVRDTIRRMTEVFAEH